ncbi:MAG: cbb3-type cytochrome c oxidase subunit II [Puniceicoccales bacterium]
MKNLPLLFAGIFFCLAFSFSGLILSSLIQYGHLEPVTEFVNDPNSGEQIPGAFVELDVDGDGKPDQLVAGINQPDEQTFPIPSVGLAQQGKELYISMGCLYCHSQQVRRKGFGADFERGWGDRQTVPRDYILQQRVLLGTSRTGPDLMSIGMRQPSAEWHHLHLYNPQFTSPGSIMPPFRFLYETRKVGDTPSPDALNIPDNFPGEKPPAGYEVVPTDRAKQLVAYLMSLQLNYELPESRFSE